MVHHFIEALVKGSNHLKHIRDLIIHVFFEIGGEVGKLVGEFSTNDVDHFTTHFCEVILHIGQDLFSEFFGTNRPGSKNGLGWGLGSCINLCGLFLIGMLCFG